MIKLCIFDMDGTVVNTINSIAYFANNALNKHGYPSIDVERYKKLVGNGADILVHRMLAEVGGDDGDFDAVSKDYNESYDNDFFYLTEPYAGIIEMLSELEKRGIKAAILSNKPNSTAKKVSDKLFGSRLVALCYGAREGKALKPDPQSVLEIIDEFKVKKEECLYIGDTATDMKTAENAGLFSVGVLWGFRDRAELESANAKIIVENPKEIIEFIDSGAVK